MVYYKEFPLLFRRQGTRVVLFGRLLYMCEVLLRANIYVDGFNVYYNLVINTKYKWLDIGALCTKLFPRYNIVSIKYFTANVKSRPHDLQASTRQEVYLRALKTIPNLTIVKGRFVVREKKLPYSPWSYPHPELLATRPLAVPVVKTEEKQSDVNLATHLLVDCYKGEYDIGIIISNDADLKLPIEMVVKECGKDIGVVNPQKSNNKFVHKDLAKWATLCIHKINKSFLRDCQFPPNLTDSQGAFTKPLSW